MKKTLIVTDMQNDFVTGSLGTPEAVAILENVRRKIAEYEANGDEILYTMDTHFDNYLDTYEGRHLPVIHCIQGTWGWQIVDGLDRPERVHLHKYNFGYPAWAEMNLSKVEIIGVCTDICVVSNALIIKSTNPDADVTVDAACCAGVTPAAHKAALATMKSCQIQVIHEEEEKKMKIISTDKAPAAIGPYSQAIVSGGLVYTSGQIAIVPETGEIREGCIKCQTKQVMENLKAVLEAAGASFESTVKTTCFLADMNDFAAFNSVYEKYFTGKPARSCVAVKTLPKGVMVEVEAVAEVNE